MSESILVGGQAVLEGVLMRVPFAYATAVRTPDGKIKTTKKEYITLTKRKKFFFLPIVRGVISLFESLKIGLEGLHWSAEILDSNNKKEKNLKDKLAGFLSFALATILGFTFFFYLPILLVTYIFNIEENAALFNLSTGILRIVFFIGYLFLISTLPDIKRVFQYHGAEHKVVFAFENGLELVPGNVEAFSTHHPRCGTSFIFIVLILSILAFALIDTGIILVKGGITLTDRIVFHLVFLPVVLGLSYEFLRFSSKHQNKPPVRFLIYPGLLLQRITTKEPDGSQLEVAIVALKEAFGSEYEKYRGKKFTAKAIE